MKDNIEDIPAIVFDWLESYDFAQLSHAQKSEALRFFSMEEYNELHDTLGGIKSIHHDEATSGRERIKATLLEHFDAVHRPNRIFQLFSQRVPLWKAAAAFFLCSISWLGYNGLSPANKNVSSLSAKTDTVYINKEVAPAQVKIHDTVYLAKREKRTFSRESAGKIRGADGHNNYTNIGRVSGISILSIKELESAPNLQRGNSMKDDSMLKKYAFVTL